MTRLCYTIASEEKPISKWGWIDYKKAYDMVPHSWILESLRLVGVATNIVTLMERSIAHWKKTLTSGGKTLYDMNIRRSIFQVDSLFPVLFVIEVIPMTSLLRQHKAGYNLHGNRLNHLLFMGS